METPFSYDVLVTFGVMGLFLLILAYVAARFVAGPVTIGNVVATLVLAFFVSAAIQDSALPFNVRCIFFLSATALFYIASIAYLRFATNTH